MQNANKLKIAFFGTPYVARDTFDALYDAGYIPTVVVTNPDSKQGRGQVVQACETKMWAHEHNIEVLSPEKIDTDTIAQIAAFNCDYAIVVAYGKILPQTLIDIFPKGILNVHYSLLPKYRGAAPVETALLQGETVTGVTIQKLVLAMDAGDILAQESVTIGVDETAPQLKTRLIAVGTQLLLATLPSYEAGTLQSTPQDHTQATFAPKILKEERELILTDDAEKNWNKYRAYAEAPGTHFFVEKNGIKVRVKIITAELKDGTFTPLRVIPEGKNEMDYSVFLQK
jgi:methionyl-tRNA formyltransferase